jgi:hypothetical protein
MGPRPQGRDRRRDPESDAEAKPARIQNKQHTAHMTVILTHVVAGMFFFIKTPADGHISTADAVRTQIVRLPSQTEAKNIL